jgi:hypothetical protein
LKVHDWRLWQGYPPPSPHRCPESIAAKLEGRDPAAEKRESKRKIVSFKRATELEDPAVQLSLPLSSAYRTYPLSVGTAAFGPTDDLEPIAVQADQQISVGAERLSCGLGASPFGEQGRQTIMGVRYAMLLSHQSLMRQHTLSTKAHQTSSVAPFAAQEEPDRTACRRRTGSARRIRPFR